MGLECKFICEKHPNRIKFNGRNFANDGTYSMYDSKTIKQCMVCEKFFKNVGKNCPCCGANMRFRGRSKAYKKKLEGLIKRIE